MCMHLLLSCTAWLSADAICSVPRANSLGRVDIMTRWGRPAASMCFFPALTVHLIACEHIILQHFPPPSLFPSLFFSLQFLIFSTLSSHAPLALTHVIKFSNGTKQNYEKTFHNLKTKTKQETHFPPWCGGCLVQCDRPLPVFYSPALEGHLFPRGRRDVPAAAGPTARVTQK